MSTHLKGIGITDQIAIGKVIIFEKKDIDLSNERDELPYEVKEKLLLRSIEKTKKEIETLYENLKERNPQEAEIFNFHKALLEDEYFLDKLKKYLKENFSASWAVKKAVDEISLEFENIENELFRERAKDIKDVGEKLIKNLLGYKESTIDIKSPRIIVARDLAPSDTATLDKSNVIGFITEFGSPTSHTAILAQALGIPAIVGVKDVLNYLKNNDEVILDTKNGLVIINPSQEEKEYYYQKIKEEEIIKRELENTKNIPVITSKGKRIKIFANIGDFEEGILALKYGAEGVGLFRTEFLFLNRNSPPSEEEQFLAYRKVAELFREKPVIIRTIDIGGDKKIPYLNLEKENNPFLGIRGLRLCLREKDLFKTQLRAILKASYYGNIKIMYPMVSIKEEIEEANNILEEVKRELEKEEEKYNEKIEVGIMVEVPSIALSLEEVIDLISFVSIGSNDLIQYTFAADRTLEKVNYLYLPKHPAILKLIKHVINVCHENKKEVGVCGEIAGDLEMVTILAELEIDELSMAPTKIPLIKKILLNLLN